MARFTEAEKKVRRRIMGEVLEQGTCPKIRELRDEFNLSETAMGQVLKNLEAGIVIALQNKSHVNQTRFQGEKIEEPLPELGEIYYARPFATFKNQHKIYVNGEQKWYGECAVESCGVSALFPGKEVVVESKCRLTKESIEIVAKDGIIKHYSPKELCVHVGFPLKYFPDDVVGWCDYNSFFVSEAAVWEWKKKHLNINKGICRSPEKMNRFIVELVGKGRLSANYQFTVPILKILSNPAKYGFTKTYTKLGIPFIDPFWLPTYYMVQSMKKNGLKNYIRFKLF
jgi:hypothetical protein